MKNLVIIVLLLAFPGCLVHPRVPERGQDAAGSLNDAGRLVREGKYQLAHDEYQRVARTAAGTPLAEEATYRSARVLIASRNPSKDYAAGVTELERYLFQYPSGRYADESADLIAALDFSQQARVQKLLQSINALEKKIEAAASDRLQAVADRERTIKERDALLAERDALEVRLAAVAAEREELLKRRTLLLQEQSALVKDNRALKKKVEALKKENEQLFAAKEKLDKDLRDITAIDVKMEKERKKMK